MNTINFDIKGHEIHIGEAVIVENYNEGTIYVENNLPGEVGTLTTRKIGEFEGYAIYENYYDSGSIDYSYFAIRM